MKRVILDTNILLRIVDKNSAEHPQAYSIIKKLLYEGYEICIIPQVAIEFQVVSTRPIAANGFEWDASFTAQALDDFENIFTMLPENELIFTEWKKLVLKGIKGKRAHDARIVANAL